MPPTTNWSCLPPWRPLRLHWPNLNIPGSSPHQRNLNLITFSKVSLIRKMIYSQVPRIRDWYLRQTIFTYLPHQWAFPGDTNGTEPTHQCRMVRDSSSILSQKILEEGRQPAPIFLPDNPVDSGAWRAMVHRASKELNSTKRLTVHISHQIISDLSKMRISCYIHYLNIGHTLVLWGIVKTIRPSPPILMN